MSTKKHKVFVLAVDGEPLTPTTPARARKLLKAGQAKPVWSKFGTFGIQVMVETRRENPETALGVDVGTKFEGYAVVCGKENSLSIKLDLPDKKKIVKKLDKRRTLRRNRRRRKCRRRPARSDNRKRDGFIAPSQLVIVNSRLKILRELFRIYPITLVGLEDIKFNHARHRWGQNFSTAEIGKQKIREFFTRHLVDLYEYQGWETKLVREQYGYKKTGNKSEDKFTSHSSDALALACDVGVGQYIEPGPFRVVDDTYRPVRRRLHDTQPVKGGIREKYSRGTVFGHRKGLLVGTPKGKSGRLCGEYKGGYRYHDLETGQRRSTNRLGWVSTQFIIRKEGCVDSPPG